MKAVIILFFFALLTLAPLASNAAGASKGKTGVNRLESAPSPYLRQHADNPINWYTWGTEAFRTAREQNKPIFLSVGYMACYWCHVMARESFSDIRIAELLNTHFISIKVDRERRPDVDATYMLATELISQQRGWPNSVFLTPDLKPFFGVGYQQRTTLEDTLKRIAAQWRNQRHNVSSEAARIAGLVKRTSNRQAGAVDITPALLRGASRTILAGLDEFHGGLGTAPKFPRENVVQFLLHLAERDRDRVALDAALLTIDNIIRGGIHDHLAGGFHRYAIDNAWAIPHFEKMLYNQALMVRVLLKAFELSGRHRYADAARRALDFVMAHMQRSDGGLASAFDAATDGTEGAHYLWTLEEFRAVLGKDASFAARAFAVTDAGNLEGRSTLRLPVPLVEMARELKVTRPDLCVRIDRIVDKLYRARLRRPSVSRDEKVLTGWNALTARALVEAAAVLGEPRYARAGAKVQNFLVKKLGGHDGNLKRSYYADEAALEATQRDFAYAGLSALTLYDHTRDKHWLAHAVRLAREMDRRYADPTGSGLFFTRLPSGFNRSKDMDDSTLPSGNAAALELYTRLMNRTRDVYWKPRVQSQLNAISGLALSDPTSHAAALLAADIARRGETGPRQFAAHGAVRLSVRRMQDRANAVIRLQLAPDWHINSSVPTQDFLLPTRIGIEGVAAKSIRYPNGVARRLGFHDEKLSLYEGDVEIVAPLPTGSQEGRAQSLELQFQACSDRICLEPSTVYALLPADVDDDACH